MNVRDYTLRAEWGKPKNPERIVKPRKQYTVDMRIVVCDSELRCWYEDRTDMGHEWDLIELIKFLRDHWPKNGVDRKRTTPIMLVCHNPHKVFDKAHKAFSDDPQWNMRASVNTAERFHLDGTVREPKVRTTRDLRIGFFGFRMGDRHTQYFHPISPYDFMNDFRDYGDLKWPEYVRLYQWGGHVRKWMRKHKLRFSPTRGGLSAQLLRDKRFYPSPRRKVPKLTNEKARNAMPGNFYAMRDGTVGLLIPALYVVDQKNAHHYAAETVNLPNGNSLFAYGRFGTLSDKPYARENRPRFETLIREHGLFRVTVWVPKGLAGMVPPWAMNHGLRSVFLYSNELRLCAELGIEIRSISYAWTSPDTDTGLRKYAQWAQNEIAQNPDHKAWLKPTLLSAYGILGVRPRHIEMAYWQSKKGEPHRYFVGPTPVILKRTRTRKKIQPYIANTIHRGMIEAETRTLSIRLARQLENEGHTVIAIHSDAVLVQDTGQQLPLLPPPWRVKERLGGFKAVDTVSFESDELVILPGRKRNVRASR